MSEKIDRVPEKSFMHGGPLRRILGIFAVQIVRREVRTGKGQLGNLRK